MERVGEDLEAVDQARPRSGEPGGRVERQHLAGADRLQPLAMGLGLGERALRAVAARHRDDHVGRGRRDLLPGALLRALAGQAEHVLAARVVDQLRRPVAGGEHRIQPLERRDARAPLHAGRGLADGVDAGGQLRDQPRARLARVGRGGESADVGEHLAERRGVERQHCGRRVDLARDRADVVGGDRADLAQLLGHDQLGAEVEQQVGVERVDRLAGARALLDRRVDLARGEPGRQLVARDVRKLARRRRVVALVRDGDKLAAEAEREERLGRGGDEADDAHAADDMAELLSDEEIAERLRGSAWRREGEEIVREWKLADFAAAMAFANRVAEVAEAANHHPDILVHGWNKVRLSLTNHSAGGLTATDFEVAGRIDGLAA